MTLKDHASGPGVNPRDIFLFFYGVVVVIATAGAEATHRQEGQTWLSLALDDGVHPASAAAPTTDGKTVFRWHRFHRSDYLTLAVHT